MAATVKKLFTPAELGTSYATYYTVPAVTTTYIRAGMLTLVNNTASDVTGVYVHFVNSGGSADDTNVIVWNFTIPAGDSVPVPVADHVMATGDFISAKAASATSVTIHGSGVEVA